MTGGHNELGSREVKYAVVNAAASGTATVVAAVSGKRIRVLNYVAACTGNSTFKWQSFDGASTYTDLSGEIPPRTNADSMCEASYTPDGHFQTISGEALVVVVGGNALDGHLSYIEA